MFHLYIAAKHFVLINTMWTILRAHGPGRMLLGIRVAEFYVADILRRGSSDFFETNVNDWRGE